MLAWGFGFRIWRLTLARGGLFPLSADYSIVMCGAWPGTLVTWPWRRLSMTYCCAQRLWSLICVTCQSCWSPDLVALSCCAGEGCLGPEGWQHTYEMDMEHFANPSLSVVVTKCWFLGFVVWDRTYVLNFYYNPDLDDRIFDCLLTLMAAVQAEDVYASFLFVGDLNGHHKEWSGSTTTNRHGVVALDCNCVWLRPVDCWPDPCTYWTTWPTDDWCSWPSMGFCCSTHR